MIRVFRLYKVTAPDGRAYVGMTNCPVETRWRGHVGEALGRTFPPHNASGLHAAIHRFGPEAFAVEQLASARDRAEAAQVERLLIIQHRTLAPHGLNLRMARSDRPRDVIDISALARAA